MEYTDDPAKGLHLTAAIFQTSPLSHRGAMTQRWHHQNTVRIGRANRLTIVPADDRALLIEHFETRVGAGETKIHAGRDHRMRDANDSRRLLPSHQPARRQVRCIDDIGPEQEARRAIAADSERRLLPMLTTLDQQRATTWWTWSRRISNDNDFRGIGSACRLLMGSIKLDRIDICTTRSPSW
jgi:hypothetical protein